MCRAAHGQRIAPAHRACGMAIPPPRVSVRLPRVRRSGPSAPANQRGARPPPPGNRPGATRCRFTGAACAATHRVPSAPRGRVRPIVRHTAAVSHAPSPAPGRRARRTGSPRRPASAAPPTTGGRRGASTADLPRTAAVPRLRAHPHQGLVVLLPWSAPRADQADQMEPDARIRGLMRGDRRSGVRRRRGPNSRAGLVGVLHRRVHGRAVERPPAARRGRGAAGKTSNVERRTSKESGSEKLLTSSDLQLSTI
jgi:hypothetical protein